MGIRSGSVRWQSCGVAVCLLLGAGARAGEQPAVAPGEAMHADALGSLGATEQWLLFLPGLVSLTPEVVPGWKSAIAGASCFICNGSDNSGLPGDLRNGRDGLNFVDAGFHDALTGWPFSRKTADTASNVSVVGVVASALTLAALDSHSGWRDVRLVLEGAALAGTVLQVTKFVALRKRPFVRYGNGTNGSTAGEGSTYDVNDADSHLSFPSGHTGLTAAFSFGLAEIAELEGSPRAGFYWRGAVVATLAVGTLRMMAEKHYFSDVLIGGLIGAGSGVLLPWLHRRGGPLGREQLALTLGWEQGPALAVRGAF